jgi:hypothetical protein
MKNNIILILLIFLGAPSARSQSKKEQIATLSLQLDSLNQLVFKERGINKEKLQNLEVEIYALNKIIAGVKMELSSCTNEISLKNEKLSFIENELNIAKDSVEILKRLFNENNKNNLLNESRNSSDFKTFLSTFLSETFSSINFDSIVYVSSPLFLKFIEKKSLGFGRFYNIGASCNLYNDNGFGYHFYEGYFGEIQPDISNLVYFQNKEPEGGFCEEATSPDGIYYKQVYELPKDWDMVKGVRIPTPNKYKNLRKINVQIQYEKWVKKSLYFIELNKKWYLLYIQDCDCSA